MQEDRREQQNSTRAMGESECGDKVFAAHLSEEEDLLNENHMLAIEQTPHVLHNFSEHLDSSGGSDKELDQSINQHLKNFNEKVQSDFYNLRNRRSVDP
jgi:hypothetical protein